MTFEEMLDLAKHTTERFFDLWMQRIHENLRYILSGLDFRDLPRNVKGGRSGVVVAGGPSVERHRHLEALYESRYRGVVVSTDRMVKALYEHEVKPTVVVSADPQDGVVKFFEGLGWDVAPKGVFPVFTPKKVLELWSGDVYWYLPPVEPDYRRRDSVTRALHLVLGKTVLDTLGNVASAAYLVARWLGCAPIAFIGMDLSWPVERGEDTPVYRMLRQQHVPHDVIMREHRFQTLDTPYGTCTTDLPFLTYLKALTQAIEALEPVETYNCSEAGLLDSPSIKRLPFRHFLERHGQ